MVDGKNASPSSSVLPLPLVLLLLWLLLLLLVCSKGLVDTTTGATMVRVCSVSVDV